MKLEKVLRKVRNGLIGVGLSGALLLGAGCAVVPQPEPEPFPDEITIDPAHTGMITGRVLISEIEDNKVIYKGFEREPIWVYLLDADFERTGFKTKTVSGGFILLTKFLLEVIMFTHIILILFVVILNL